MSLARLVPLFALAGCLTPESYVNKQMQIYCDRLYECDKAAFEASYSDMGDCIDDNVDFFEEAAACAVEECTWDGEAASACLHDQATTTCEDWASGDFTNECEQVFTDCDALDYAYCLAE